LETSLTMAQKARDAGAKEQEKVSAATRRRLLADLRRLQEEPLPLAAAQPHSDADITLWDGVIGVEMDVTHIGLVTVPLHFLIDFPSNYPQNAPNIGFSFEFQYRGGAQYVESKGRLKGKKVICLDVLGNFQHYHQEWKDSVGSGWSPAYTITTLLVQLQSVLCDLGNGMSQSERDVTYQSAVRFCEQSPSSVLEILGEDEIRERRESRRSSDWIAKICAGDEALATRVHDFAEKAGFAADAAMLDVFLTILADVSTGGASAAEGSSEGGSQEPDVDTNICCFATGKLYTEALLGVGVSRERRNLSTAAELLSKETYDGGLRQSTNKSPFEFFLPVWINDAHAAKRSEWREALRTCYMEIGSKVFEISAEDDAIVEVFPRLINQMIVEIMRPDAAKSAAIATFEAMCNFWRTFRWLVDTRPSLQNHIRSVLSKFVTDEASRHKNVTPDLGVVLVLFTAFQGHADCPTRGAFVSAYADENSLRWVMWWQRSGTRPESMPVFQATLVSREICMFQMMVVDVVLGDIGAALAEMESTNCKLPERLERLQAQWRECKASTTTWDTYFQHIGASQPAFGSTGAWIADCVRRAAAKGPKYGGAKGEGKGSGNGGKGDAKGKGKSSWNGRCR